MTALFITPFLAAALQVVTIEPAMPGETGAAESPSLERRGGPVAEAIGLMERGQFEKALTALEAIAGATEPEAAYIVGFLYDRGLGTPRDEVVARKHFVTAAMAGQPDAQYALGRLAYEGAGVLRDYGRAYEWFNLAASQGHVPAIYMLGVMHAEGQSVPEDLSRAASLFESAAERGSQEAQHQLGSVYLEGLGRPASYEKAARWFEAAAEQGDAESQYNLALLHESGRLPEGADLEQAVRWLRAAAEQGLPEAKISMGLLHLNGRGVDASDEKAARWFADAAEAGDAEGMYLHAAGLAEGLAAPPDLDGALMWVERSLRASAGEPMEAIEQRRELRDRLRAALAERRVERTPQAEVRPSAATARATGSAAETGALTDMPAQPGTSVAAARVAPVPAGGPADGLSDGPLPAGVGGPEEMDPAARLDNAPVPPSTRAAALERDLEEMGESLEEALAQRPGATGEPQRLDTAPVPALKTAPPDPENPSAPGDEAADDSPAEEPPADTAEEDDAEGERRRPRLRL